jgi:Cu+-exporting ATPase
MDNPPTSARLELSIGGMTCGGCAGVVERALSRVPGVARASVSLETHRAVVECSSPAPAMESLIRAVTMAGFDAAIV